jgi:hypothetical protein
MGLHKIFSQENPAHTVPAPDNRMDIPIEVKPHKL